MTTTVQQSVQVPYCQLFLSPTNVRSKDAPSAEGIARLAAMIAADGLLNPLHVSAEHTEGQSTGRYAVQAGGRRWRALGLLVQHGKLDAATLIDCRLVERDVARAVSLAENLGQEPMHPADEFDAFAKLASDGHTPEQIAQRFGVKVVHVQQRMKLAALAPQLLTLYRQGKANLDQMMALASVDDQKRQLAVWKLLPDYNRTPAGLRRMLAEDEVIASDERVKVITLKRYEASGGATRRDLFTDELYLTDAGLVDLVFAEVLAETSADVEAEGWGWVEVLPSMGYGERQRFVEPPPKLLPESDDVRQRRAALEAELDAVQDKLGELYDAEDTEDNPARIAEAEAQEAALRAELRALEASTVDPAGYPKSELGAVVTVDDGKLRVLRGLMTAEAARAARASNTGAKAGGAGATSGTSQNPEPKARPDLSEALMLSLTSYRTAAIQAAMLGQSQVALAALAARLAESALDFGSRTSALQVSLTTCSHRIAQCTGDYDQSPAGKVLEAEQARWNALLPRDKAQWFSWLLTQSQDTVVALLTYCAALSVDAIEGRPAERHPADPLAQALALDMADWWTASEASYLGKVPKAKLVEAVTEACGTEAVGDLAKMKKAQAVAHAQARLDGTRWLPAVLRKRG